MIVITNIILFKEFDNKMRESIIKFYIFNTLELVLYDVNVYILRYYCIFSRNFIDKSRRNYSQ